MSESLLEILADTKVEGSGKLVLLRYLNYYLSLNNYLSIEFLEIIIVYISHHRENEKYKTVQTVQLHSFWKRSPTRFTHLWTKLKTEICQLLASLDWSTTLMNYHHLNFSVNKTIHHYILFLNKQMSSHDSHCSLKFYKQKKLLMIIIVY